MTEETIAQCALGDMPLPETPTMPEQILWYELRDLYKDYYAGKIDKDSAAAQKQKRILVYRDNVHELKVLQQISKNNADFWIRVQSAADRYVHSGRRSAEGDRLVEALYGEGILNARISEGGKTT